MKPVNPKGNQPFIFIEGLLLKLKAPILWPPDAKTDSLEKTDAGRDWGQEKGTTEDEMAAWHHRLDGCELSELHELVMDREAWHAAIYGVTKSRRRLSD